ncbi:hypothetical protein [Nonomuraea sp. NPDC049758]|uniref:hypothetical protein n=1 Tax=Nonomuraea sp. NPDC049758 TaxID=3154360 RepID=UPI0034378BB0
MTRPAGDGAALFDRHARRSTSTSPRRLGPQAADDIVAQTFPAAFRRRGSCDPATRLAARPWPYVIATKLIARHRRAEACSRMRRVRVRLLTAVRASRRPGGVPRVRCGGSRRLPGTYGVPERPQFITI